MILQYNNGDIAYEMQTDDSRKFLACFLSSTIPTNNLDFSNWNLSRIIFDGKDLRRTCFNGADLTDAQFKYCNMRRAEFVGSILKNTGFHVSSLKEVVLQDTKVSFNLMGKAIEDCANINNVKFINTKQNPLNPNNIAEIKETVVYTTIYRFGPIGERGKTLSVLKTDEHNVYCVLDGRLYTLKDFENYIAKNLKSSQVIENYEKTIEFLCYMIDRGYR